MFTSGATESNHLAVLGTAHAYGKRKRRVVTSTVEHASVRGAFDLLEAEGYEVVRVAPGADGIPDAAAFAAAVNENTCLISMMLVILILPALLLLCDKLICYTTMGMRKCVKPTKS